MSKKNTYIDGYGLISLLDLCKEIYWLEYTAGNEKRSINEVFDDPKEKKQFKQKYSRRLNNIIENLGIDDYKHYIQSQDGEEYYFSRNDKKFMVKMLYECNGSVAKYLDKADPTTLIYGFDRVFYHLGAKKEERSKICNIIGESLNYAANLLGRSTDLLISSLTNLSDNIKDRYVNLSDHDKAILLMEMKSDIKDDFKRKWLKIAEIMDYNRSEEDSDDELSSVESCKKAVEEYEREELDGKNKSMLEFSMFQSEQEYLDDYAINVNIEDEGKKAATIDDLHISNIEDEERKKRLKDLLDQYRDVIKQHNYKNLAVGLGKQIGKESYIRFLVKDKRNRTPAELHLYGLRSWIITIPDYYSYIDGKNIIEATIALLNNGVIDKNADECIDKLINSYDELKLYSRVVEINGYRIQQVSDKYSLDYNHNRLIIYNKEDIVDSIDEEKYSNADPDFINKANYNRDMHVRIEGKVLSVSRSIDKSYEKYASRYILATKNREGSYIMIEAEHDNKERFTVLARELYYGDHIKEGESYTFYGVTTRFRNKGFILLEYAKTIS